jgi:hypothetical protein
MGASKIERGVNGGGELDAVLTSATTIAFAVV